MVIHHGPAGTMSFLPLGLLMAALAAQAFVLQPNDPKSSSETLRIRAREPRTLDSLSRAAVFTARIPIPNQNKTSSSAASIRRVRRPHRERKLQFGLEFDDDLNEIQDMGQEVLSQSPSSATSDSRHDVQIAPPHQESRPLSPAVHSGSPSVSFERIPFISAAPVRTMSPESRPSPEAEFRPVPIARTELKSMTNKDEEVGRDRIESGPLEPVPSGTGERALSGPGLGKPGSAHSQVPPFNEPIKTIMSSQTSSPLQTSPQLFTSLGTRKDVAGNGSNKTAARIALIQDTQKALRTANFDTPTVTLLGIFLISLLTLTTWFTKARDAYFAQIPPQVPPTFPASVWERSFQENYVSPEYLRTRRPPPRILQPVLPGFFGWR